VRPASLWPDGVAAEARKPISADDQKVVDAAEALLPLSGPERGQDLEAFGRDALARTSGRIRLARLNWIVDELSQEWRPADADRWTAVLRREAERLGDRRYVQLAELNRLCLEHYRNPHFDAGPPAREMATSDKDSYVRAMALAAYSVEFGMPPTQQFVILDTVKRAEAGESGEEKAMLEWTWYSLRTAFFDSLRVRAQSALEGGRILDRLGYPTDHLISLYLLQVDAARSGYFPLASRLLQIFQRGAPRSWSDDYRNLARSMCQELTMEMQDYRGVLACSRDLSAAEIADPQTGANRLSRRAIAEYRLGDFKAARADLERVRALHSGPDAPTRRFSFYKRIEALDAAASKGVLQPVLDLIDADDAEIRFRFSANFSSVDVIAQEFERNAALSARMIRLQWGLFAVCLIAFVAGGVGLWSQHRLALRLKDALKRADAASAAKSTFLATISHEIRTPLNGVLGMAQVMAQNDLDAGQRERLQMIQRAGGNLMAILNDVLDLARIEAGKLGLEEVTYDIRDLVDGLDTVYRPQAEAKGLRFQVALDPAALGAYRGDAMRLNQVLGNVLANAVKLTERGEVSLSVACLDETLAFTITDTGPGLDAAAQARIFERFVQADSSSTRRHGGAGLGLAICREILALMGGAISVRSEPGAGACFLIEVPQKRVIQLATLGAPEALSESAVAELKARRLRVLAAEDDAVSAIVLKALLDRIGAETVLVGDGRSAVEAYASGVFDLVLLDVEMPVMDGLDAVRLIRVEEARRGGARAPVIAVTASAMAHQLRLCLSAGFDDRLSKPILADDLFTAIRRAMDGAREIHPWSRAAAPRRIEKQVWQEQRV
jgi:signal transduction histidine kinase/CheY-like chemotaxis protein